MEGRDLVRSVKAVGSAAEAAQGMRTAWAAWRRRRLEAALPAQRGAERARVPGLVRDAEPGPGGGVVRFARSELRVTVAVNGAVFWAWDGAGPGPSYALPGGRAPEADPRAVLEPDKDGAWRVVAERVTVVVSRHGAVEVRTPGGLTLRRDLPPRWWEPVGGGPGRWMQRFEVAPDARFFGLGGQDAGPRLRDGTYRLWNGGPGAGRGPGADGPHVTVPVQLVVSDAGAHLVFHDNTWDGTLRLREGREGAGSGHDRDGGGELRMDGGPLRCWVMVGTPGRVLHAWAALTGAAAQPPAWALGHRYAGPGDEREVRRAVADHRARGIPLDAVHLDAGRPGEHRPFTVDQDRFPKLPVLAEELRRDGTRLVAEVGSVVRAEPGDAVHDGGGAGGLARETAGRAARVPGRPGEPVRPDFTHARVRAWWGERHEELLAEGFAGFRLTVDAPRGRAASGPPWPARYALEGRGGGHREAHNVYALCMARAAHEGLPGPVRPEEPFVLSRSGWAGTQRYGGVCSGDVPEGWPGLRAALSRVIGLGLCGVPYAGCDVGPQDAGSASGSAELFVRRLQMSAYFPLLRTQAGPRAGHGDPWGVGGEALEHARAALAGRRRLLPHFVTLAHLARRTGVPVVRPVWWAAPEDRALRDCEDAFLLGECLLVAPVLAPGTDRRAVRLPQGRWYDTVTGEAYEGPGRVLVDAPPSRIPVLARAGAVLPVRGEDGGLELEAWAPARGRTGGGLVVTAADDGKGPVTERYVTRLRGGRVVVERHGENGPEEPSRPVRVRGPGAP
ncbi:glycoside hydrolase family 31 protein [Streptomyces minutiscleroticus]|uniref:glycoside hydrolase family 31 protein n=1 Tax=Streptomyces minutiscleroticus TaxID=68238 RepID=UPI00331A37C9